MTSTLAPDQSLPRAVGALAAWLAKGASTGDVASLRRMDPVQPPPLALYRAAAKYLPPSWDHNRESVHGWMAVVGGLAIMAPDGHRGGTPMGKALAQAGVREASLERLLASRGETRLTLVLRAARFMAAKGAAWDWVEAAYFTLAQTDEAIEKANMRTASGYYREASGMEAQQKKE